jgi:hypothetical protein
MIEAACCAALAQSAGAGGAARVARRGCRGAGGCGAAVRCAPRRGTASGEGSVTVRQERAFWLIACSGDAAPETVRASSYRALSIQDGLMGDGQ